jgi:hypothetical protein
MAHREGSITKRGRCLYHAPGGRRRGRVGGAIVTHRPTPLLVVGVKIKEEALEDFDAGSATHPGVRNEVNGTEAVVSLTPPTTATPEVVPLKSIALEKSLLDITVEIEGIGKESLHETLFMGLDLGEVNEEGLAEETDVEKETVYRIVDQRGCLVNGIALPPFYSGRCRQYFPLIMLKVFAALTPNCFPSLE